MVRPERDRLFGEIEEDETYVSGAQEGKRGRGAKGKSLVVIAAELNGSRKIGRIRLQPVPDASAGSLIGAIEQMIEPGSLICTDGLTGYDESLEDRGCRHTIVRQE